MSKLPQVQVVAPSRSKAPAAIVISEGAAAKPETSGIKRGAKMWSAMAKAAFVISALLCAVSAAFMVDLASDLGKSWWEVVTLSAIALALAGLSPLLLAFAAFLEDTRPVEAARIVQGWKWLITAGAIAVAFFVFAPPAPLASGQAAELRAALAAPLQPTEWEAWRASQSCEVPQARHRATCEAITKRRAEQWAKLQRLEDGLGDWSPAALIGTGKIGGMSEGLRRLLVGVLAIAAWIASGLMTRIAALTYDEANRRADGIAPAPAAETASFSASPGSGLPNSPKATADLWFRARVHKDVDGWLNPSEAYADYVRACSENSQPPLTDATFFNLLAARAKAENIERTKRNGRHGYAGWVMSGEADFGTVTAEADPLALPY